MLYNYLQIAGRMVAPAKGASIELGSLKIFSGILVGADRLAKPLILGRTLCTDLRIRAEKC